MKRFLPVVMFSATVFAGPICSDLQGEGNSFGANVAITPYPAWQPNQACGQWVSFAATGFESVELSNTNPGVPTATFWERLELPPGDHAGHVTVWADDTAAVYIQNSGGTALLFDANYTLDVHCADGPIGCQWDEGRWILLSPYLTAGTNHLYITSFQLGGGPFGVMYDGWVEATGSPIPEPGTWILIAGGIGLIALVRRRMA